MKKFEIPVIVTDQRNSVTALHPMKYLVWLDSQYGPQTQLWAEDWSVSPSTNKRRTDIIKIIELHGTDQYQSLKALTTANPCPELKEDKA